ncbi:hypothetical protein [uncultured Erythrobacter sp.]|uniref:hypothetical protein n=1 Tax=uncultured Erythrobacter sp. TaxID=263913 RepID=UPI0026074B9F|nr:hypothetical protein [uncultured Erythrobacter sp.]
MRFVIIGQRRPLELLMEALAQDYEELYESLKKRVKIVDRFTFAPFEISIKLELPDIDEETLEPFLPLFQLLTALIEKQAGEDITAVLKITGPDGETVDYLRKSRLMLPEEFGTHDEKP